MVAKVYDIESDNYEASDSKEQPGFQLYDIPGDCLYAELLCIFVYRKVKGMTVDHKHCATSLTQYITIYFMHTFSHSFALPFKLLINQDIKNMIGISYYE